MSAARPIRGWGETAAECETFSGNTVQRRRYCRGGKDGSSQVPQPTPKDFLRSGSDPVTGTLSSSMDRVEENQRCEITSQVGGKLLESNSWVA